VGVRETVWRLKRLFRFVRNFWGEKGGSRPGGEACEGLEFDFSITYVAWEDGDDDDDDLNSFDDDDCSRGVVSKLLVAVGRGSYRDLLHQKVKYCTLVLGVLTRRWVQIKWSWI